MKIFGKEISEKKFWIIGLSIIVLMFFLGRLVHKHLRDSKEFMASLGTKKPAADTTTEAAKSTAVGDRWAGCNDSFPLKKGSCGAKVVVLQHWLLNIHRVGIGVHGIDGKLGDDTVAALKKVTNRDNVSEEYWNKTGLETIKI